MYKKKCFAAVDLRMLGSFNVMVVNPSSLMIEQLFYNRNFCFCFACVKLYCKREINAP